jgi:uncharacterized protein (TIGR03083 family)
VPRHRGKLAAVPGRYPHERFCDLAAGGVARFAEVVRGADPATPVRTCGRWTLADLIQHLTRLAHYRDVRRDRLQGSRGLGNAQASLGHVHRWAAGMVAELARTRHRRRKADLPLPPDPATWPGWVAEAQRLLVPVLRAADPEARVWAWGPDKHVRFWSRRMVHETAVHRVDAELALGIEPLVDPAVAVDGVEELLENLPRSRALCGNGERLRLRATDQPEGWTVTLGPERFDWVGGGPDRGPAGAATRAVTVQTTAAELYLLLWRRRPPTDGRFEVSGDRALLAHWLQHSVVS